MWNDMVEKLPEKDGEFLVTISLDNSNDIRILYFHKKIEEEDYWYDSSCWGKENVFTQFESGDIGTVVDNVTHWMELPAFPKFKTSKQRCEDCAACNLGYFASKPDEYVCIGVQEPFIIEDITSFCTEYK